MSFARHSDCARALALADTLADRARSIARSYFRRPLAVEHKPDRSPVTVADREIETELRRLIRAAFPAHGIRGEEFAAEAGGEFTWVLDPIDGTKSFITGFPLFGSLIALLRAERPVLGVIEVPALGERWFGSEGAPTVFNGTPVRTSACNSIAQARLYTTTAEAFQGDDLRRYQAVAARAQLRRYGGDCYIYGLLASGHCDLVIEAAMQPHDFQALVPVVEGAGGRISDWNGRALDVNSDERVLAAATPALWEQALEVLADR